MFRECLCVCFVFSSDSFLLLLQCESQESGGIIQQRRLEKDPACFAKYKASTGNGHNFLLASRDCTLQVFVDFNVVWAAKLPSVPVHVSVADFGSQKGLIVTVDDSGKLSLGYLGTKPPLSAVVSTSRDVDYDKVDEEHRTLLQVTGVKLFSVCLRFYHTIISHGMYVRACVL